MPNDGSFQNDIMTQEPALKKMLMFILDKCYECYDVNLLTFTYNSRIRFQICILILILQDRYFNGKGNLDKYFA